MITADNPRFEKLLAASYDDRKLITEFLEADPGFDPIKHRGEYLAICGEAGDLGLVDTDYSDQINKSIQNMIFVKNTGLVAIDLTMRRTPFSNIPKE